MLAERLCELAPQPLVLLGEDAVALEGGLQPGWDASFFPDCGSL